MQIIECELEGHGKNPAKQSKIIEILKQNNADIPILFFDLVKYSMNNITNFQNDLIASFTKQDQNTNGHSITYYPGHKGRQFVYNNTRTMNWEILNNI